MKRLEGHHIPIDQIKVDDRQREDLGDVEGLAVSFSMIGQIEPIVVTKEDLTLIAGRRRLAAASSLEWKTIQAVYREDCDEVTLKLIELEENIRRKSLTWQEEVKAVKELHDLMQEEKGVAKPGPGADEGWSVQDTADYIKMSKSSVSRFIQLAEAVEDHPELLDSKNTYTAWKRVRRLEEEAIKNEIAKRVESVEPLKELALGDGVGWMRSLDPESVDFILTDPPYGKNLELKSAEVEVASPYEDDPETILKMIEEMLVEGFRVLKDDRVAMVFFDIEHYDRLVKMAKGIGFQVCKYPFIWVKETTGAMPNDSYYSQAYELVLHLQKGYRGLNNPGLWNWKSMSPPAVKVRTHPVEKPKALLRYFIQQHTLPGEVVIDPFMGGGSTILSALYEKRVGMGCELREEYYNTAVIEVQALLERMSKGVEEAKEVETEEEVFDPEDFREIEPGSQEWLEWWNKYPEDQDEMLKWARNRTQEVTKDEEV